MNRIVCVFLAGLAAGAGGTAAAQHAHNHGAGPVVKPLSSVDTSEEVGGKPGRVTTFEVTFAPGASSAPHRHPGAVFGYVLEGEFETQLGGGPLQKLKAGDTFYEPTLALHAVSRNPGKTPTRVLAVMHHPRDAKELVIPEPAAKGK